MWRICSERPDIFKLPVLFYQKVNTENYVLYRVYADLDNSEDYAEGIHKEVKQQSPKGLFMGSHEKENATYLLQSLMEISEFEKYFSDSGDRFHLRRYT